MTREEAIANLNMISVAFVEPVTKEQRKLIDDTFDMAIKALEQEASGDVISRKAVLKAIDVKAWEFCDYLISEGRNDEQKPVSHFADNLRECVGEDLPPVTPQPKIGHWIKINSGDKAFPESIVCSVCGGENSYLDFGIGTEPIGKFFVKSKYCPNCGAKMVEPQESEVSDADSD